MAVFESEGDCVNKEHADIQTASWFILHISAMKKEIHTSETLTDFAISSCWRKDCGSPGIQSRSLFVFEKWIAPL